MTLIVGRQWDLGRRQWGGESFQSEPQPRAVRWSPDHARIRPQVSPASSTAGQLINSAQPIVKSTAICRPHNIDGAVGKLVLCDGLLTTHVADRRSPASLTAWPFNQLLATDC